MSDYNILDEVRGLLGEDDAPITRTLRVRFVVQRDDSTDAHQRAREMGQAALGAGLGSLAEAIGELATALRDLLMDEYHSPFLRDVEYRAATMTPEQQRYQYALQRTRAARRRRRH